MLSKRGGIAIIVIVVILVIGGGAFFMLRGGDSGDDGGSGGGGGSVDSTNFDEEWNVFQSLLSAIEERDKAKLESLFYLDYFPLCTEAGMSDDNCWILMEALTTEIGELEKNDYTILGKDDKQTIIATDITQVKAFFVQHHLYFVRNNNDIWISGMITGYYEQEEGLLDRDGDGLSDHDEICQGAQGRSPCIESDPEKKDTDGDGWWDGAEAMVETDPTDANDYPFK